MKIAKASLSTDAFGQRIDSRVFSLSHLALLLCLCLNQLDVNFSECLHLLGVILFLSEGGAAGGLLAIIFRLWLLVYDRGVWALLYV